MKQSCGTNMKMISMIEWQGSKKEKVEELIVFTTK
jgi:hypothetical protein